MTAAESLRKYGTVVFSEEFMEQTLRVDVEGRVQLDHWLEFVPTQAKPRITTILQMWPEQGFKGRKLTPKTLSEIVRSQRELVLWEQHGMDAAMTIAAVAEEVS